MIQAGEVWIEGAVPLLTLPVIKQMDEEVIHLVTDAIFNHIVTLIDVTAIRLVNPILQSRWETASESLSLIALEQGADSDAYKKALADSATAFARWVHTGPE